VEGLSSWRSFGGGVHPLARIDGGCSTTEQLDCGRMMTGKLGWALLGFGWEGEGKS
jgi:hypothetical protein